MAADARIKRNPLADQYSSAPEQFKTLNRIRRGTLHYMAGLPGALPRAIKI
jgi:hypothetical protein